MPPPAPAEDGEGRGRTERGPDRGRGMSSMVRGALLMTGAAFGFAIMLVLVRQISAELHPFQIAFLRFGFGVIFLMPWLLRRGAAGWRTARFDLQLWRAAATILTTLLWFSAIALLPLAQAVSLNFTIPLFATMGAALFLGETVRLRRWTATAVGLFGTLVILRPGFAELSWPMVLPIAAAGTMAAATLIIKVLTRTDSVWTVVVYQNVLPLPFFLIIALFVWQTPSWIALGLTVLVALLGTIAHVLLTRAFSLVDASAIVPFDYSRLPFAAFIAFLAFGEVPDVWTWAGAAIIAGAAIYIARREAYLERTGRRAETAPIRPPSPNPTR